MTVMVFLLMCNERALDCSGWPSGH